MAEYKFYLKQPPASELLDNIVSVVQDVNSNCQITHFTINTNSGQLSLIGPTAVPAKTFKEHAGFKGVLKFLVDRPFVDVLNLSLSTNDDFLISARVEKAFLIVVSVSGHRENKVEGITPISDALHKHLNLMRQDTLFESFLPDAERGALQTARTILLDFASQAARLSQLSASNTERMNEVIIKRTDELDARFAKKNAELEDTVLRKNQELETERAAFLKEKAKFDSRENTVVRRDLLGKIQAIVEKQKQIEITLDTTKKRTPIQTACIIMMGLAICLIAAFGYKVFNDSSLDWHHIIPFSTGMILFISTAIFYIRWNDQWFKEHASAEFENRQFSRDIVRASWIAELLFEWKEKKEVPFPEQLVTSYTKGLFQGNDVVKTTKHPFDDLKSLAGSVSEIKFSKKGGFSLKKNAESEE